jgi:hypothetical protein
MIADPVRISSCQNGELRRVVSMVLFEHSSFLPDRDTQVVGADVRMSW